MVEPQWGSVLDDSKQSPVAKISRVFIQENQYNVSRECSQPFYFLEAGKEKHRCKQLYITSGFGCLTLSSSSAVVRLRGRPK